MKIAVVMGGATPERDVSLASGRGILKAVELLGHMAIPLVIDADGNWLDGQHEAIEIMQACDVTIPALHGKGGEDGRLQGFLEQLHIPYVGSGIAAGAVGLDKHLTKAVLKAHGIPVTPGVTLRGAELTDTEATLQKLKVAGLDFPLFVKPANGGSSSGVTRGTNLPTLLAAIAEAAAFGPQVLVEREMEGREIELAVLEFPDGRVDTAPALEIHPDPEQPFFNATAKYGSGATRFVVPARIDPELAVRLRRTAIDVFEVLGCAGLARVDFFVPRDGEPVVNEINTFPGFTPASQYPRMWAAAGLSYAELVGTLIRTALAPRSISGAGPSDGGLSGCMPGAHPSSRGLAPEMGQRNGV